MLPFLNKPCNNFALIILLQKMLFQMSFHWEEWGLCTDWMLEAKLISALEIPLENKNIALESESC